MNTIKIDELSRDVAKKNGSPIQLTKRFTKDVFSVLADYLSHGQSVYIHNLGTFKIVTKNPKKYKDLNTGEVKVSDAHNDIKFMPSVSLKNRQDKSGSA